MRSLFKTALIFCILHAYAVQSEPSYTVDIVKDLDEVIDFASLQNPATKLLRLDAITVVRKSKDVRREILQRFVDENKGEKVLAIIEWGGGLGGVYSLFLLTDKNVFWWNWRVNDPHDQKTASITISNASTPLSSDYVKKYFGDYAGQEGAFLASDRMVLFMTIYDDDKVSNAFFCDFPNTKQTNKTRSAAFQQLVRTVSCLIELFKENGVTIRFWVFK